MVFVSPSIPVVTHAIVTFISWNPCLFWAVSIFPLFTFSAELEGDKESTITW